MTYAFALPPPSRRYGTASTPAAPRAERLAEARAFLFGDLFERKTATPLAPTRSAGTSIGGVQLLEYGASREAVAKVHDIIQALCARPDVQLRLADANVVVVMLPEGTPMTDLPEFQSLRGRRTFDGRPWEEVRGSGGTRLPDGRTVVAIPVENLTGGASDRYGPEKNISLHEIAHAVQDYGLPPEERREIDELFARRTAASGPWTTTYASNNVQEYFAESAAAYFDFDGVATVDGREWLQRNDPEMYAALTRIFTGVQTLRAPSSSPPA